MEVLHGTARITPVLTGSRSPVRYDFRYAGRVGRRRGPHHGAHSCGPATHSRGPFRSYVVVNGKRQVAPNIQEVVRRAVLDTGYVPNLAARSLVTRRTGTVAVVVSGAEDAAKGGAVDFADPFFGRAVGGLLRALRPHEVDPILMIAETRNDRARVMSVLHSGNADGALLVSTHADDPLPAMLVQAAMPAVMFARPSARLPISFVDVANRDGAALAAQHLSARGRHRVAVISGPLDVPAAADRLTGFQDAMARLGHPYLPAAQGCVCRRHAGNSWSSRAGSG